MCTSDVRSGVGDGCLCLAVEHQRCDPPVDEQRIHGLGGLRWRALPGLDAQGERCGTHDDEVRLGQQVARYPLGLGHRGAAVQPSHGRHLPEDRPQGRIEPREPSAVVGAVRRVSGAQRSLDGLGHGGDPLEGVPEMRVGIVPSHVENRGCGDDLARPGCSRRQEAFHEAVVAEPVVDHHRCLRHRCGGSRSGLVFVWIDVRGRHEAGHLHVRATDGGGDLTPRALGGHDTEPALGGGEGHPRATCRQHDSHDDERRGHDRRTSLAPHRTSHCLELFQFRVLDCSQEMEWLQSGHDPRAHGARQDDPPAAGARCHPRDDRRFLVSPGPARSPSKRGRSSGARHRLLPAGQDGRGR